MTTNNNSHPCKGYDAALGDLVIKIEHYTRQHNVTFGSVMQNIHNNEFTDRFLHIARKYEHKADDVIDRMYEFHEDWEK